MVPATSENDVAPEEEATRAKRRPAAIFVTCSIPDRKEQEVTAVGAYEKVAERRRSGTEEPRKNTTC